MRGRLPGGDRRGDRAVAQSAGTRVREWAIGAGWMQQGGDGALRRRACCGAAVRVLGLMRQLAGRVRASRTICSWKASPWAGRRVLRRGPTMTLGRWIRACTRWAYCGGRSAKSARLGDAAPRARGRGTRGARLRLERNQLGKRDWAQSFLVVRSRAACREAVVPVYVCAPRTRRPARPQQRIQ